MAMHVYKGNLIYTKAVCNDIIRKHVHMGFVAGVVRFGNMIACNKTL